MILKQPWFVPGFFFYQKPVTLSVILKGISTIRLRVEGCHPERKF